MKKTILFGVGHHTTKFIQIIEYFGSKVDFLTDNDKNKIGTSFNDIEIVSPQMLIEMDCQIIISCIYHEEISMQLKEMGVGDKLISLISFLKGNLEHRRGGDLTDSPLANAIYLDLYSESKWGGAENWNVTVAKALIEKKRTVAITGNKELNYYEMEVKQFTEEDELSNIITYFKGKLPLTFINSFSGRNFFALLALKVLYSDQVKIINVVHGDLSQVYSLNVMFDELIDHYICVSSMIRERMIDEYNISADKVTFLHQPIKFEECYSKRPNNRNTLKIGMASRLEKEQKRCDMIPILIEHLEKLKVNYRLNIAGDGVETVTIQQYISDNKLSQKVTLFGHIKSEKMLDFWKEQDVYINISEYEGTSLAMLEAMSVGCVPVVTNVSGVSDFIRNGYSGFICDIGNMKGIAKQVKKVDENRKLLEKLGSNAKKEIISKCDIANYADKLIDIIEVYWGRGFKMEKIRNKSLILYGAKATGINAFHFLHKDNQIALWVDKNYVTCQNDLFPVSPVEHMGDLENQSYDFVVICVVKESVAQEIREILINEYSIPEKKIIDFTRSIWMPYIREKYREVLRFAVPSMENGNSSELCKDKIKVRVYFMERKHAWNVLKSVCVAFERDARFDLLVILNGHLERGKYSTVKNDISNVVYAAEYDLEEDRPNIVIVSPFSKGGADISKIAQIADYVCQIPIGLLRTDGNIKNHIEDMEYNLNMGRMECSFVDKLLYKEMTDAGLVDERVLPLGNPKFDEIFRFMSSNHVDLPEEWKKLTGKKVILWTTDHYLRDCNVTTDLYINNIIEFFIKNEDIALIFRPHPHLLYELIEDNIWTQEELAAFQNFLAESSNIVFDCSSDYSLAYYMADGIISDVNCGITVSALPLGKPLGVLSRSDGPATPLYPQLIECLYQIKGIDELVDFINMVRDGKDDRKEDREKAAERFISHYDGQNGERIKQYIVNDYRKKYGVTNE